MFIFSDYLMNRQIDVVGLGNLYFSIMHIELLYSIISNAV